MAPIEYKEISKYRIILLILLVILAIVTSYRVLSISQKIFSTLYADNNYNQKNIVAAEEYYSKAANIDWFDFKNSSTEQRMKELQPITFIKNKILAIANLAEKAVEDEDANKLLEAYTGYKNIQKTSDSEGSTATLLSIVEYMDFEKDLTNNFKEVEKWVERHAQSNISNKDFTQEAFLKDLNKIPDEYLGNKKNKQVLVTTTITEYERNKLEAVTSLRDMDKLVKEANKISVQCKEMKIQTNWLFDKLDECGKQIIESDIIDKKNSSFYNNAKIYLKFAKDKIPNSKSAVYKMVSTKLSQDLKAADKSLLAKEYDKALGLYIDIGKYSDTTKLVSKVIKAWESSDPATILSKIYKDIKFTNLTKGNNLWDATFYVIASSSEGNIDKLYLGKITKDSKYTGYNAEVFKDGAKIKAIEVIKSLEKDNPIIIALGSSQKRKSSYIGYDVHADKLREVFRFEADKAIVNQAGVITVTNPVGKGEGQTCYFGKVDGIYKFKEK